MSKTISLDTYLLVLLIVGLTDPNYIEKHKRLKSYTIDDFNLLRNMIVESSGIAVTPNALSEASNFLRNIDEPAKSKIYAVFRNFIQNTSEIYIASTDACSRNEFFRFGLADNAMLEIGRQQLVVLSTDARLCIAALNAGYEALNFNHYRNL